MATKDLITKLAREAVECKRMSRKLLEKIRGGQ